MYPRAFQDKILLSKALEMYLSALESAPLHARVEELAFDTRIPAEIFRRLAQVHRHPEDQVHVQACDFHVLFSNLMFRYPTLRLWLLRNGEIFVER